MKRKPRQLRASWTHTGSGVATLLSALVCTPVGVWIGSWSVWGLGLLLGGMAGWLLWARHELWTEGDQLVYASGGTVRLSLRRRDLRRFAVVVHHPPFRLRFRRHHHWRPLVKPFTRATMRKGANLVLTSTAGEEWVLPVPSGAGDAGVVDLAGSLERWRRG